MKWRYAAIEVDAPTSTSPNSKDPDGTPLPTREDRLQQALFAHQAGAFDVAAVGYGELLLESPEDPTVLFLFGTLALQLRDYGSAIRMLEQASRLLPNQGSLWENLGSAYLGEQRIEEAARALQVAVRVDPGAPSAHYNLANILSRMGNLEGAKASYRASLERDAEQPAAWFNLGNTLMALDDPAGALEAFSRVQRLDAHFPSLKNNRAHALFAVGREAEATAVWFALHEADPYDHQPLTNLGVGAIKQERHAEAIQWIEKAIKLCPSDPVLWALLGTAQSKGDNLHLQVKSFGEAVRLDPTNLDYRRDLAISQVQIRNFEEAIEPLRSYLQVVPADLQAHRSLAQALYFIGEIDEAILHQRSVVAEDSAGAKAQHFLGVLYREAGNVPQAMEAFKAAVDLDPSDSTLASEILLTKTYLAEVSEAELLDASQEWAETYANFPTQVSFQPRPQKQLHIGLVSADFHAHPAGHLYKGLIPNHDRDRVRISLYVNQDFGDDTSVEIVKSADAYRFVKGKSDGELCEAIRTDKVDILVDLLGHTPNHRLPVFGRHPAPIQATFLGYFATTGMSQMDYILADRWLVPHEHEQFYSERVARIEGGSLYAYLPPSVKIEPNDAPILSTGTLTFGCFNNLIKINRESVALWAEVLRQVPTSRMILTRLALRSEGARARILSMFQAEGIAAERIELRSTRTREEYFRAYHDVDVMLDTVPFGAGTTTSDALWMGVPVVSLPTSRFAGRMTQSIYNAVGIEELLPEDTQEYIALAKNYAEDGDFVQELRSTLRPKLLSSPMCDLPAYAKRLEDLYHWMWNERTSQH